jgi:hypothetical protein
MWTRRVATRHCGKTVTSCNRFHYKNVVTESKIIIMTFINHTAPRYVTFIPATCIANPNPHFTTLTTPAELCNSHSSLLHGTELPQTFHLPLIELDQGNGPLRQWSAGSSCRCGQYSLCFARHTVATLASVNTTPLSAATVKRNDTAFNQLKHTPVTTGARKQPCRVQNSTVTRAHL